MKAGVGNSQDRDWSHIPDIEISKQNQPDNVVALVDTNDMDEHLVGKIETDLGPESVAVEDTNLRVRYYSKG